MGNINRTHRLDTEIAVSTTAYSDGDVIGGLLDLSDLCGAGGGGTIRQVRLVDDHAQSEPLDLYLFDGKPTVIADHAAFAGSMAVGDLAKLIGVISIAAADYVTLNSNEYVIKDDINLSHGTGQLWGYLVANGGTPDYNATTDLTLFLVGWKD